MHAEVDVGRRIFIDDVAKSVEGYPSSYHSQPTATGALLSQAAIRGNQLQMRMLHWRLPADRRVTMMHAGQSLHEHILYQVEDDHWLSVSSPIPLPLGAGD